VRIRVTFHHHVTPTVNVVPNLIPPHPPSPLSLPPSAPATSPRSPRLGSLPQTLYKGRRPRGDWAGARQQETRVGAAVDAAVLLGGGAG